MFEKLISRRRTTYVLVFFLALSTLVGKFFFHGLIFGLDFSLFHPDGTLYTFRTLSWLGNSQAESATRIAEWYGQYAGKMTTVDPASLYFDQNPNWELYKFRFLYSFLSIPFVYLFGLNGMLIIPALSYIGLMWIILEIGISLKRVTVSLLVILILNVSITVTRWMFINTTDSLFAFLAALSTFAFIKWNPGKKTLLIQMLLLLLMSLTRVSIFYATPLIALTWFKSRKQALVLSLLTLITFLPLMTANIQSTIAVTSATGGYVHKSYIFLYNSLKLLIFEIGQLFILDKILLLVMVCTITLAVRNSSRESSRFFLLSIVSTYMMSFLNGTLGVNFRFQLSVLAAVAWVLIESWPKSKPMSQ